MLECYKLDHSCNPCDITIISRVPSIIDYGQMITTQFLITLENSKHMVFKYEILVPKK